MARLRDMAMETRRQVHFHIPARRGRGSLGFRYHYRLPRSVNTALPCDERMVYRRCSLA